MLIVKTHYDDQEAKRELVKGLQLVLDSSSKETVFLCLGSERHILDCFGPLVGTMLSTRLPDLQVYGTLDYPLNARNLVREIRNIKQQIPNRMEIAIDASLGVADDIGVIKLKQGSLAPGKALAKSLPPIGHLSLIGIVGAGTDRARVTAPNGGSLAHVYHMASVVCAAIVEWYSTRAESRYYPEA